MSFATEIQKNDSERFVLVRFKARRYLQAGLFTNIGGNFYEYDIGLGYKNIDSIIINGSPPTSYSYDEDTGIITIESSGDLTNVSTITILIYNFYITNTKARVTNDVGDLPNATWEPLLNKIPNFSQSMRSVIDGVFSLSSSNIQLISTDGFHRKLFGPDTSICNSEVFIWACINDLSNYNLVFSGEIVSGSYNNGVVTIGINDTFSKLNSVATFGSTVYSRHETGNANRPYILPSQEQKAIPITIGYSTPYEIREGWRHLDAYGEPEGQTYHISGGLTAVKYSPQNPDILDTVNFDAGRIVSSDILRLNFGTISSAYRKYVTRQIPVDSKIRDLGNETISIVDEIIYLQCSSHNCEIGDYIPPLEGWVCQIKNSGFGSYNLAISKPIYGLSQTNIGSGYTSGSISVPSLSNNTYPAMSVWIEGGDSVVNDHTYTPLALVPDQRTTKHATRYVPFTLNSFDTYTDGGQTIKALTFNINPTTAKLIDTDSNQTAVNPLINTVVKYRMRLSDTLSHSQGLKFILKSAGMTVNEASFTQADSDLDATLSMTIPLQINGDFPKYLEACQAITGSTLGVLSVNDSREVVYRILDTLTTADHVRDTSDLISDESSVSINYQDMYDLIVFEHPQIKPVQGDVGVYTADSQSSSIKRYLHDIRGVKIIRHYLKNITNIFDKVSRYVNSETIEYNITTSSKDLNTSIGDVVEITSKASTGFDGSNLGVVVSVDKSTTKTTLKINELRGV